MSDPLRVAIVDDTPDMRLLVRLSLELDPLIDVVGEAGDGRGAVDLAAQHAPEVMLLDLAMPVMDGMQALPLVLQASPDTAVLVLSGFAAGTMADQAIAAGARGYLQKGIGAEELCQKVWEASGRPRPEESVADPYSLVVEPTPAEPAPSEPGPTEPDRAGPAARAAAGAGAGLVLLMAPDHLAPADWLLAWANPSARAMLGLADDAQDVGDRLAALAAPLAEALAVAPDGELALPTGTAVFQSRRTDDEVVVSLAPTARPRDRSAAVAEAEVERLRSALATTAHELRSPVGVIVGLAETLRLRGPDIPETQRAEMRAALARQSDLLRRLTDDLVTASSAHHGEMPLLLEPVAVVPLVRAAVGNVPDRPPVEVVGDPALHAYADPTRVVQIVTNLVTNSWKYAVPPYAVAVRGEGEHVLLEVSDRGNGVPEHFRPLLFEEYTRATSDGRGTGLGLYVVRALARALGGDVDHRPGERGGSVFTVRLPRHGEAQTGRPDSV